MSLSGCIRKAGKALSSRDATAIQTLADDFEASGMVRQEAEQKAIEQHISTLQGELDAMVPGDLELAQKQDQTETPEFKTWFGDSKVVDAEGKPLVVYHGTTKSFNTFSDYMPNFFTASPEYAEGYGDRIMPVYLQISSPFDTATDAEARQIYNDEFRKDPLGKDAPELSEGERVPFTWADEFFGFLYEREFTAPSRKYDGIVVDERVGGNFGALGETAFVPLENTQIKSAIGNKGTFDPNDPNILNQAAYHGTPHKFDKFSLEAIGTGEGAQAFGWGLYFAGDKEIANWYKEKLTLDLKNPFVRQMKATKQSRGATAARADLEYDKRSLEAAIKESDDAIKALEQKYADNPMVQSMGIDAIWGELSLAERAVVEKSQTLPRDQLKLIDDALAAVDKEGQLYQVDIPEDSELLNLDVTIDKQSEKVRSVLQKIKDLIPESVHEEVLDRLNAEWEDLTGREIYKMIEYAASEGAIDFPADVTVVDGDPDRVASLLLNHFGIPGSAYFDRTSRTSQEGTRNYVIWDESAVTVESVNDQLMQAEELMQSEGNLPRGTTLMNPDAPVISLSTASDMSTFLHETMHLFMLMEQQFAKEFGVTDNQRALLESVGVTSFEQLTREHHEQLAESFEVYLREGKAPSVKLMDAFNTFRAWLLQVYKTLRQLPNQKLDDKMRAAFDRLLATEEEIQQAAASPAFMQMFRTKEQAGMTDAEWADYQEAKTKRDGRAVTKIEEKIIYQMKQRKTKEWKQERDVLAREEEARLAELPVYKILANTLKRTDDDMARPLDRKSIESILGVKNVTGAWIRRTSNDGTDPQLVSEAYGYETVEDMVQEINEALPIREAAIEAAEARMKEKYGDILNDGTLEAEVMTALHNVKDVDKLYAELRALDSTQTLNRDLLKAEARRIIGTMKNSEIRPSKFHQNMIRAAQRAATSGSKAEKVMAKQQQLVNHYLYKEAVKAKKDADRFTKYVNKVKTRKYDTRHVHPDYVHTMKMLANLYTTKSKTTDADIKKLVEFYNGQEAAMTGITLLDPQLIVATEAVKRGDTIKPIMMKNMTMVELQGLYLSLKNLRHVGGRMSEERAEAFKQRTAALTKSVIDNGGPDRPETIAPGPLDNLTRNISGFLKSLPSLRNFMRWLDGGNDYGEAFKQIYRPIEDANNNKMRMHRELYERFEAELSKIDQVSLKRYGAKKVTLDDGRVIPIHGEARFMIALYWGTESSREALREGHGFTDNDVARILSDMSKPELELLNAVWRLNESIWPEIVAAHIARTGVAPPKLNPTPFVVNGFELTGGHMRLYYLEDGTNPVEFSDAKPGQFDSLVTRVSGTMIERVGSGGRKVLLDKGNITRAINDAIHYTAFANPSIELAAIMNDKAFQNAVRLKHGDVFYNQMVETMRSVVTNKKDRDVAAWLSASARFLRRNLTAMHLMYSIRNVVQQVTALPLVMEEVGPVNFVKALGDFVVPGNEHVKFINESSEFMRNRAELVNREAHEQLHNIAFGGPVTRGLKTLNDYGFFMQTTVDSVFAYPTWKAKYEAEMMKHGDHKIAVSQADTAVAESVGSGSDLHLGSAYQQSRSELMKSMTQFGSFFNSVIYQRYKRANIRGDRVGLLMALSAQPIILGVLAAVVTMDMPEDEEELPGWFFEKWGSQLAGMYPFVRDIYAAWQGFNKRGIIPGAASAPVKIAEGITAIVDDEPDTAAGVSSDIIRGTATLVPLPGAGQVARVLDFIDSNAQGKEQSEFKYYQMLVEGKDRNE